MTILGARALSKAYGEQTLFHDVSLTVTEGDRIGLLGVNGSGKSTLLRVLAGLEPADGGVIDRRRGARIAYLPQEPELRPDATAREIAREGLADWHAATARHEEVTRLLETGSSDALLDEQATLGHAVERLGGWQRDHLGDELLTKLGIADKDRAVGAMSGGERRRVALARLLVSQPELMILDEPTNHLDTDTIEWLETLLGGWKGAVLLVTHDRYALDAIATRILELDRGMLREYRGNYGAFLEQKATLLEQEGREEQNRQNLVRRELAWLRRGAQARSTKQKARIQRAEALVGEKGPRESATVKLEAAATRTGKTILELRDVGMDVGGRTLVDALTLHLRKGDRIGVIGPNGVGKTTLLRLVTGDLSPSRGEVVRGTQTKLAYFDQARAGLVDDWSIFDNVADREGAERSGGGMVHVGERAVDLRTYLEQFLFEPSKQRQKVGSLSGGERARVGLAKMLKTGANLLLLDEPTNDLDVSTLGALEEMLSTWPGCALVVTHDRWFLNRVATSVLAFERGSTEVLLYPGGYDDYRAIRDEQRALRDVRAPRAGKSVAPPSAAPAPATKKKLTYGERLELEGILDVIAAAEDELAAVEKRLSEPGAYTGATAEARTLEGERTKAQRRVTDLTARWEDLESRKGTPA